MVQVPLPHYQGISRPVLQQILFTHPSLAGLSLCPKLLLQRDMWSPFKSLWRLILPNLPNRPHRFNRTAVTPEMETNIASHMIFKLILFYQVLRNFTNWSDCTVFFRYLNTVLRLYYLVLRQNSLHINDCRHKIPPRTQVLGKNWCLVSKYSDFCTAKA